ncbi:MAG: ribonuclease E/G, partial [Planctomycetes bacterium]|nr:ribonuclease E/G [Planctomycetota bacterium]
MRAQVAQHAVLDLVGIIVVDFFDMMKIANIKSIERAFKAALDTDRARNKIGRISQFGLLELTRQRLGPG